MSYKKYPSLTRDDHAKNIQWWLDRYPELENETYQITEKLDGANLQFNLSPHQEIQAGKRSSLVSRDTTFMNMWVTIDEKYQDVFEKLQDHVDDANVELRIYGEIYGQGIQNRVWYGDEKYIRFFDIMVNDVWLSPKDAVNLLTELNLLFMYTPIIGSVDGIFNAIQVKHDFMSYYDDVKPNGKHNYTEGVVMNVPNTIKDFANDVFNEGGKLFIVGGAVRDHFMSIDPFDFDLLIVGLSEDVAMTLMNNPQQVIGNAPVFMWNDMEVALARKELSTTQRKDGFEFIADETITVEEDLERRDFTINAMAWDIIGNELIDPFNGVRDILDGILNPVSEAFMESPERVLRGASFAARFDFKMGKWFGLFARQMSPFSIPKEQVWRHFEKAMDKGIKPSRWIEVLDDVRWLERLFPTLHALKGCKQDSEWHPEGDALTHTKFVVDELDGVSMRLTGICHDLGKPDCTIFEDGRIKSPKHDKHIQPTIAFLDSIGCFNVKMRENVIKLVQEHMVHIGSKPSKRMVRRLSKRLHPATIEQLSELVRADVSGRPPRPKHTPQNMLDIVEIAQDEELMKEPFNAMMKGRHLIGLGMKPSKEFGQILKVTEEAQINGEFDNIEGGIEFLKSILEN